MKLLLMCAMVFLFTKLSAQDPDINYPSIYRAYIDVNLVASEAQHRRFSRDIDSLGNLNPDLIYYYIKRLNAPVKDRRSWILTMDRLRKEQEEFFNQWIERQKQFSLSDTVHNSYTVIPRATFALDMLKLNFVPESGNGNIQDTIKVTDLNFQKYLSWLFYKQKPLPYEKETNYSVLVDLIESAGYEEVRKQYQDLSKVGFGQNTAWRILKFIETKRRSFVKYEILGDESSDNWYFLLANSDQAYLEFSLFNVPTIVTDYFVSPLTSDSVSSSFSENSGTIWTATTGFVSTYVGGPLKYYFIDVEIKNFLYGGMGMYHAEGISNIHTVNGYGRNFLVDVNANYKNDRYSLGWKFQLHEDNIPGSAFRYVYSWQKDKYLQQSIPLDTTVKLPQTQGLYDRYIYTVEENPIPTSYSTNQHLFLIQLYSAGWIQFETGWQWTTQSVKYTGSYHVDTEKQRFRAENDEAVSSVINSAWDTNFDFERNSKTDTPVIGVTIHTPFWLSTSMVISKYYPVYQAGIFIPIANWFE